MTSEERECMEYLCKCIAIEKDPRVFDKLVEELNDVLELQYRRIHPAQWGRHIDRMKRLL